MSRLPARAGTLAVAGALALAALRFAPHTPPAPPLASTAAAPDSAPAAGTPLRQDLTLDAGESLAGLLARAGVREADASAILAASAAMRGRTLPAGLPVSIESVAGDSAPSEVVFALADDRRVHVRRAADGWAAEDERVPWRTDTVVVSGTITSSLYGALDRADAPGVPRASRLKLAWTLADIFEYRVDMSRELQVGDRFQVLVERAVSPGGAVRLGDVLAARLRLSGTPLEAIRFGREKPQYFDGDGKSLRLAFLRAPVQFRRISSVFGLRKHPILGIWRAHKGTDYAAGAGTPVRTVGDGVVIFAGQKGGYGNVLEVRHRNGMVSRYGHLRAFARGVRGGARVDMGQTIGFVGATGLATAPHLHFEVLVDGVQRDPRRALASRTGVPVAGSQRPQFDRLRQRLLAAFAADTAADRDVAMR